MKKYSSLLSKRAIAVAILLLLCTLGACTRDAGDAAVPVSGKTVWGNLAIENLDVMAKEESSTQTYKGRSGYHGSFRLNLPPGVYTISASGLAADGVKTKRKIRLFGEIKGVQVSSKRIDRLVIPLLPLQK